MDRKLRSAVRPQTEDRVLTKTMINNYAKNDLLPPPVKKKYSKEHVLMLIFIYYYKGVIPMNEIQTLLKPRSPIIIFKMDRPLTWRASIKKWYLWRRNSWRILKKDVVEKFRRAEDSFTETAGEEQEIFTEICPDLPLKF